MKCKAVTTLRWIKIVWLMFAVLEGCTHVNPPTNKEVCRRTYRNVYLAHFSKLQMPEAESVRKVGMHKVYPVRIEEFWEACLDVVWQYDVVGKIDTSSRMIVFSHGIVLPYEKDSSSDTTRYWNALVVVLAEARGVGGTDVYVAWLPPESLIPVTIETPKKGAREIVVLEVKKHPRKIAAVRVATQFLAQVSTQLFGREKWLGKLNSRQNQTSAN